MKNESLIDLFKREQDAPFSGWDFTHIASRMQEDPLPWNYKRIIEDNLTDEITMLDIDTGGGEFLNSFEELPKRTYATEAYEPNIPIAKERLSLFTSMNRIAARWNRSSMCKVIRRPFYLALRGARLDAEVCADHRTL